jgi:hypothetical protein
MMRCCLSIVTGFREMKRLLPLYYENAICYECQWNNNHPTGKAVPATVLLEDDWGTETDQDGNECRAIWLVPLCGNHGEVAEVDSNEVIS